MILLSGDHCFQHIQESMQQQRTDILSAAVSEVLE
jgi:hypothetical protein